MNNLKVLHLNSYDIRGGAANSAYRLVLGLKALGLDASMLVQIREGNLPECIGPSSWLSRMIARMRPLISQIPLRLYPKRCNNGLSSQWLPESVVKLISNIKPDIINLHWVCAGFLKIESLPKLPAPVVWTLHDTWAFTGGCHYANVFDCSRFTSGCGCCPLLGSNAKNDLSASVFMRKQKAYSSMSFKVICPSNWLASEARRSLLLSGQDISVIPYGIDTTAFRPADRNASRESLGLPLEGNLALFVAAKTDEPSKGLHLLLESLHKLSKSHPTALSGVIVMGNMKSNSMANLPFPVHCLGYLAKPEQVIAAYNAADLFTAPSMHDNLPNTVLEALACGTPTLAFDIGGMADMITHKENGYLAHPFDTADLADGLQWLISSDERKSNLSQHARQIAEMRFSLLHQARAYLSLYKEVLNTKRH